MADIRIVSPVQARSEKKIIKDVKKVVSNSIILLIFAISKSIKHDNFKNNQAKRFKTWHL